MVSSQTLMTYSLNVGWHKFTPPMRRQYCGFSQINAADMIPFDGTAVQSVTARDKRLQLASV